MKGRTSRGSPPEYRWSTGGNTREPVGHCGNSWERAESHSVSRDDISESHGESREMTGWDSVASHYLPTGASRGIP